MPTAPVFKAVTKDEMAKVEPDAKGTLTSFWNKKNKKPQEEDMEDLIDEPVVADPPAEFPNDQQEKPAAEPMEDAQDNAEDPIEEVEEPAADVVKQAADAQQQQPIDGIQQQDEKPDEGPKKRKRSDPFQYTTEQLQGLQESFKADPAPSKQVKTELATRLQLAYENVQKWFESARRKEKRKKSTATAAAGDKAAGPSSATETPADKAAADGGAQPAALEGVEANNNAAGAEADAVVDDGAPEAMDIDEGGVPAVTPAAELKAPATVARATNAVAAEEDTKKKAAATTAPTVDMQQVLARRPELEAEAAQLKQTGLAAPLIDLAAAATKGGQVVFSDATVAVHIVGQRMPLEELVTALVPIFKGQDGGEAPTADIIRNRVADLGTRKSHAPKHASKSVQDPLADATTDLLWQWELRDNKVLPKEHKAGATLIKRQSGVVASRLSAIDGLVKAVETYKEGASTAKVAKAFELLNKTKTIEQFNADLQAEKEAAATRKAQAATKAKLDKEEKQREKERLQAEKEAEKERLKAEKEAEKERLKAEKEAEKERLLAEKEAEKEKARLEKEAEKERLRAEKEASLLSKKTGFKDPNTLHKSQNKFMSFFSKASSAKPSTQNRSSSGAGPAANGGERTYADFFPKPNPETLAPQPVQPLKEAIIDAALAVPANLTPFEEVLGDWHASLQKAKQARVARKEAKKDVLGLPPSWSRTPTAMEHALERSKRLKEDGVDQSSVSVFRRKLIFFPADSKRPAYYGSWRSSSVVGARRYLAKDDTLDYDVMSDLDWEEEPEGMSLSDADDDDEAGAQEEEELEDSFMVEDGYLSEDEGVQLEEDGSDVMDVDGGAEGGEITAARVGHGTEVRKKGTAFLAMVERARRSGKPLVISRIQVDTTAAGGNGGCVVGDASLLAAFAMEVLLPDVKIAPPVLDTEIVSGGGKKKDGSTAGAAAPGPKKEDLSSLLPDLARFIKQNSMEKKKETLVNNFVTQFSTETRKVTKKWVDTSINELAEKKGKVWVLKPESLQLLGVTAAAIGTGTGGVITNITNAAKTPASEDRLQGTLLEKKLTFKTTPAGAVVNGIPGVYVGAAAAPPSATGEMKAPARLVTSTTVGAAGGGPTNAATAMVSSSAPLVLPEVIEGPDDAFWQQLLERIEDADDAHLNTGFETAFSNEMALQKHVAAMPAYILTALVSAFSRTFDCVALRQKFASALNHVMSVMVAKKHPAATQAGEQQANGTTEASAPSPSLSQKLFANPRTSPNGASLEDVLGNPQFLETVPRCLKSAAQDAQSAASVLQLLGALQHVDDWKSVVELTANGVKEGLKEGLKVCQEVPDLKETALAIQV